MLRELNETFDKSAYPEMKVKDFSEGATATIKGSLSVAQKVAKNNSNYLVVGITDKDKNTISQTMFKQNSAYTLMEEYIGKTVNCEANVKFVMSGKYKSMEIQNIGIVLPDPEKEAEKAEDAENLNKTVKLRLKEAIKSIKKPILRDLVLEIYKEPKFAELVVTVPATEFSAYNYEGGLAHMILDTVIAADTNADMLNTNFWAQSLEVNFDLMRAGALLCNIGRAFMLKFNENGKIVKTEEGVIENDLSIARDMIQATLADLKNRKDDEGNPAYEIEEDLIKELLHMVSSSRSKVEFGALVVPRTKHAMLLSNITSLVYTKGLFENLEREAEEGDRFSKAYDNGRAYFLPNNVNN